MKNILTFIVIINIFMLSCSSDDDGEKSSSKDLCKAVFSLKNITFEPGNLVFKNTSLQDLNIKYLEYWIYNSSDLAEEIVTAEPVLSQQIKNNDFGKNIIVELPAGDYSIFFYAADTVVEKQDPQKVAPTGVAHQMFSAEKSFTLNKENSVVSESISFERLVGKIELVIQDLDQLPSEVQSITPFMSGFSHLVPRSIMPVKPTYVNILKHFVVFGFDNEFSTIPRSQFSSINEQNPITIYTLPSEWDLPPYTIISYLPGYLYIQGSKDEKFHTINTDKPWVDQEPLVSFVYKVAKYRVLADKVIRYTGKIGNLNDENAFEVILQDNWDEIDYEIDK